MNAVVIDTNVLLVANQQHADISAECVLACTAKLMEAKTKVVVVDDGFRILNEYQIKTSANQNTRMGDVFLKWLLQNKANTDRVHQVTITENPVDHFAEFPDHVLQPHFDAPDRKFPAVANAHADKPPVLQAADCKWLNWWPSLHAAGIVVDFVCPADVCGFYGNKYPGQPVPAMP